MRIGIFTDSYKPYTSGVVTSICTFKAELEKLGHKVYIFAPSYHNYHEEEPDVFRYHSVPAPTNPDYTLAIPVLPGMRQQIKRLNLDIIHVHSPAIMGRVGMHYARLFRLPIVFTYHTLYEQYTHYLPVAQVFAKDMTVKFSSKFCNDCDHVIVPAHETLELLSTYDIITPISVIPTGVPLHKYVKKEGNWLRDNFPIPAENKILLFVGRLTKEKNLEFLINAFKEVHEKRPHTTLVITAQGPLESHLKKIALKLGLNLEQDIIFSGAVPYDTLIQVYYAADLFVFSSLTETQGLVLIEAMAAGLPVVAVRASGVQEMVDDGVDGILTELDINQLTEAICKVMDDENLYNYFKTNALLKAQALSSQNMALKQEAVYENLLSKKFYRPHRFMDVSSWFSN
ncbi:MAG TPA: glycosyltransferase family 4 protein [Syntrophomonadaceae bacterium]|mgnify:CR=1 FL=1|nr:glycosyltransferase family 4 protein [Syntrophomonadaceae bacterium]HNX29144.1 glycosyltransferase family 4 protein [Syntrophomonadaceae bacterium]HPR93683.1 glycosyltransferase family 4 protein [Syntrophomonadaceae bacterium]